MRASQITAGLFAGALALLGVMSAAEKPFDAQGDIQPFRSQRRPRIR